MDKRRILIAPSLLACNFGHLADEVRKVEDAGADWLHVDIMDGHFVPNLTAGPDVVKAIRKVSRLPLDVHLMVEQPQWLIHSFVEAGSDYLTVHVEAPGLGSKELVRKAIDAIRESGVRVGLSLRPRSRAELMKPFLDAVDLVLVMSVEPGFGGQEFMPEVVPKVKQLREWFAGELAVDGGINAETAKIVREAGANIMVSGTYIFKSKSYQQAIGSLRRD